MRESRAWSSQAGSFRLWSRSPIHCKEILSKASFWSQKMTAVPGASPAREAALSTYCSTAAARLPSRACQAGPGTSTGRGPFPRCAVTLVMLGPHCPPFLAAWLGPRRASTAGPMRSARVAPWSLLRDEGRCSGLMSLGVSAAAFFPTHTDRSTEGPRTVSRTAGFSTAAHQACASRQATNLAPGR
eukprot:7800769-Pyramimonas_sp.AAC.1